MRRETKRWRKRSREGKDIGEQRKGYIQNSITHIAVMVETYMYMYMYMYKRYHVQVQCTCNMYILACRKYTLYVTCQM